MSQSSRHRSRTPPAPTVRDHTGHPHPPHHASSHGSSAYTKGNGGGGGPPRALGNNITNQIRPAPAKSLSTSPLPKRIRRESYKLAEEVHTSQQDATARRRQDPLFRDAGTGAFPLLLHQDDFYIGDNSDTTTTNNNNNGGARRRAPAITAHSTQPLRPGAMECVYTAADAHYAYVVATPADALSPSCSSPASSSSLSTPVTLSSLSSLGGVSPITEIARRGNDDTETTEELEQHARTPRGEKRQRRPLRATEEVEDGRHQHSRLDDTPLVAPEVLRLLSQNTLDAIPLSDYFHAPM